MSDGFVWVYNYHYCVSQIIQGERIYKSGFFEHSSLIESKEGYDFAIKKLSKIVDFDYQNMLVNSLNYLGKTYK